MNDRPTPHTGSGADFNCAEKYCDGPGDVGTTVYIDEMLLEVELCEPHFDELLRIGPWSRDSDASQG